MNCLKKYNYFVFNVNFLIIFVNQIIDAENKHIKKMKYLFSFLIESHNTKRTISKWNVKGHLTYILLNFQYLNSNIQQGMIQYPINLFLSKFNFPAFLTHQVSIDESE